MFDSSYPADGNSCDGHRRNIMNGVYTEVGVGVTATGTKYYTEDFGAGTSAYADAPISSGAHLEYSIIPATAGRTVGKTRFMCTVDLSDASAVPSEVRLLGGIVGGYLY